MFSSLFDEHKAIEFGGLKLVKCLEYIGLSDFNPVPMNRKAWGDLLYIKLKTLEQSEYCITCNPYGFYVNESNEKLSFNPSEHRLNPSFSHSLVGLVY